MFLAAGVGIGCGLAVGMEFLDKNFRKPQEIQSALEIDIYSTIPWILTPREKILRSLNTGLSITASLAAAALLLTFAYTTMVDSESVAQLINQYVSL
jgi:hypothetical protein